MPSDSSNSKSEDIQSSEENGDLNYQSHLENGKFPAEKKSIIKTIFVIIAIGFFFAGFNLTIFFDGIFLKEFLASIYPPIFNSQTQEYYTNPQAASTATFIKAFSSLIYMVGLIVGGAVSDNIRTKFGNRVPMILGGSTMSGLGYIFAPYLILPISPLITGFIVYFIIYLGLGFAIASEYALVSELFTKNERGWAGLGLAGFGFLGTAVGLIIDSNWVRPFIKIETPENINWNLIFFSAGFIIILFGFLTFLLTPKRNSPFPPDDIIKSILNTPNYLFNLGQGKSGNRDFLYMFIVGILWGGAGFMINSFLPDFIGELGPGKGEYLGRGVTILGFTIPVEPGSLMLMMGLAGIFFAGPIGFLIMKIGKVRGGMLGSIILGIFTFLFAQKAFWGDTQIFGLAFLGGIGLIFIVTVNVSLPADIVPRGKEAQFMGIFALAAHFVNPIAGVVAGFSIDEGCKVNNCISGYATVFTIVTLLYFSAIGMLAFMHYESTLESEYQLLFRRFLIFRGTLTDKRQSYIDKIKK